jgi:predicted amidophosphoribosyltransferase
VRILLAPACASCARELDRPLEGPVCPECWRAVPAITPPWCERCGDALPSWRTAGPLCARCRRRPDRLLMARSAGRYDGSLRRIIQAFKYEQRRLLARPLARLMAQAGADWLAEADAVVPVPLHPWRAWQRGFNQADDLARHLGPPVWAAPGRRRGGPPQASLPAARRHGNVRGAFALARWSPPFGSPSWLRRLAGRRVVLVVRTQTRSCRARAPSTPSRNWRIPPSSRSRETG